MELTIGLLYDLEKDFPFTQDSAKDANSEFDSLKTINAIKRSISQLGHRVLDIGNFCSLLKLGNGLQRKADLVFNLAEGVKGRNREAQTVMMLEYWEIPFVGSDALTLSAGLDKVVTKQILRAENIPTAKYFVSDGKTDVSGNLKFPLIVKPRWEGSSMGINLQSIVENKKDLLERIKYIKKTYQQPAIVEEFIEGREFTVPVFGFGSVYSITPLRVTLEGKDMGNKVYDNRFINDKGINYMPYKQKDKLASRLKKLAINAYRVLECRDFGRVDFRVNKKGEVFVLEINPLPALNPDDALAVSARAEGKSYSQLIGLIIEEALKRYRKND